MAFMVQTGEGYRDTCGDKLQKYRSTVNKRCNCGNLNTLDDPQCPGGPGRTIRDKEE